MLEVNDLGLKLYSTNINYIASAKGLLNRLMYDYIELYVVPDSYGFCVEHWKEFDIPFVIHAPHFMDGMNFSVRDKESSNRILFEEAAMYADCLRADKIICHPGVGGQINETIRQLKYIADKRIVIENKPYHVVYDSDILCVGSKVEEIEAMLMQTGLRFCLDVGHCFCAANSLKQNPSEYLKRFLNLRPAMLHISDNDIKSTIDQHLHLGDGSYDFRSIMRNVDSNIPITIETQKDKLDSLDDFINDVNFLKNI